MAYFWAEEMLPCQLIISREQAWDCMNQIGNLEFVHFNQKNVQYDSPYMNNVKTYDQILFQLTEIRRVITQLYPDFQFMEQESYKKVIQLSEKMSKSKGSTNQYYFDQIKDDVANYYQYFKNFQIKFQEGKHEMHQNLKELGLIITAQSSEIHQVVKVMEDQSKLYDVQVFICDASDTFLLERQLFRVAKSNQYFRAYELDHVGISAYLQNKDTYLADKKLCVLMHQKGSKDLLKKKLRKVIQPYSVTHLKQKMERWQEQKERLKTKIKDFKQIDYMSFGIFRSNIKQLYQPKQPLKCSYISYLEALMNKQRMIYQQLSYAANISPNFLTFEVFVSKKDFHLLEQLKKQQQQFFFNDLSGKKELLRSLPTKFTSNQIMEYPQQIVNTYGVPSHDQFNPAFFYIVTFSFFIGVMFGDLGHTLMIIPFIIGFKINKIAWITVFFMGFCGILYNEFFGLNLGLFQSCYTYPDLTDAVHITQNKKDEEVSIIYQLKPSRIQDCVFVFGIDSTWRRAENQMQFTNSLKMKMAVILGVIHMILGLIVRIINFIKQKKMVHLFTLAIPQMIFMLVTFTYMVFLIVKKWTIDFGQKTSQAPSIISTMLGVFIPIGNNNNPALYENQVLVENLFFGIAICMIPVMFLGLPIKAILHNRKSREKMYLDNNSEAELRQQEHNQQQIPQIDMIQSNQIMEVSDVSRSNSDSNDIEKEDVKEVFVHSLIETIEYVLGTVSNTASYLRLWALSLAHSQLSEVIFSLILEGTLKKGFLLVIMGPLLFIAFYLVTFLILSCMDTMECFLHSLRLHWVEFQNKFFQGKGFLFEDFNFKAIQKKGTYF